MPKSRLVETDPIHGRRFAYLAAGFCALVSLLPFLYGKLLEPVDQAYLGYQFNSDDHMVYSAWMHQASEGRFFFDNRFATDPQPGLTVHLYFFVLGLLGSFVGLSLTAALAKSALSGLFVILLYRLLTRLSSNVFFIKLALSVAVVGGGLGFFIWHRFGEAAVATQGGPIGSLLQGRLPIDVWQPEAFVFPSMLTNGLFMASLCLIVGFFLCVLEARESWRPVPWGFLLLGLLMNIHSYDVLLVVLVLVGFLAASIASRTVSGAWLARVGIMGLGALGPALWFWHVYRNDPVFQARAATDTFTPNFRAVLFGLIVMAALSLVAFAKSTAEDPVDKKRKVGAYGLAVLLLALFVFAGAPYERFWMGLPVWVGFFLSATALIALMAGSNPAWNLFLAWALAGLAAIYFPALFQRKLAMGLSIPWAVLAAAGLWKLTHGVDRGTRNLVAALGILVLSASSVRWFLREGEYIRADVSRTTVHSVFLTNDVVRIVDYLDRQEGRKVVLAMPGIGRKEVVDNSEVADSFQSPYMPDLNAVLSGLAGCYTYAGHWSETPDYLRRRGVATAFFLTGMDDAKRREILQEIGATHLVAPVPEAFDEFFELTRSELANVAGLGRIAVDGTQFRLIELGPQ
jgi:hypothetical protein